MAVSAKGTNADLLRHASATQSDSFYVATSSNPDIGQGFAGKNGWTYVIHTNRGIDVNATLGPVSPFPEQAEFAIPGGVLPSEIYGAYPMKNGQIGGKFIPNTNFKPPGCNTTPGANANPGG